jgi:hypothetical protein
MANNNFKQFANAGGANVVTQTAYEALTTLLADGFASGTALSNQLNKVWRQSATMAAAVAQLIADITGQDVIDDGTINTILGNLISSVMIGGYAVDSGVVNAYVITLSPAPIGLYDGMQIKFKTANANTSTTPTINVNGLGAVLLTNSGGAGVVIGQIVPGTIQTAIYNLASSRFEMQSSGAVPAGTILTYAGGTVPSGYLLCPTVPTNVSTTTYASLFAALSYNWGGSGANFGLPYFAAGYTAVQGTIAVLTHGALLAHTHPSSAFNAPSSQIVAAGGTGVAAQGTATGSTGGADNLAAGMGTQFIVKY